MVFHRYSRFLATTLSICALSYAQSAAPRYFSVPGADAPELARRGAHSVGVRTLELVHSGQVDILKFDRESGKAPTYDRPLTVEIWYPATIPAGQQEQTSYQSALPGNAPAGTPKTFEIAGKALRDAPAEQGQAFPLVVVSHGYPGSRTFLSYLTENLASKGYVVAAIDHTDSVFGAVKGFQSTLLNRSLDQLFTVEALAKLAGASDNFLHGLLDASRVAIVGYSMGGYGALASGGAGYSAASAIARMVPGGYFNKLLAGSPEFEGLHRENLKAIVAIAPWGGQPPQNAWDKAGLAGIRVPSLFIDGDQDDISDYAAGVKPAFEGAVHSDRWMLVYENARHNVGGNPPPPEALAEFSTQESFDEPVWRKDRIAAINQHFITAFLDLQLKGDESRRAYLDVPVVRSNDGAWPLARGERPGAAYNQGTGKDGQTYWKGFQRRWALGLQLHHLTPAAKP
ncbi:alpha/beta hydrolase family protein [Paludibaculum fermentans]|uniref:Dienelactone hydrolase n=1 Tax=Paludibaculum fermentans TaxID=1473598 RepID=A0A7S7NSG4_PALFE|nr:dienelactone hydrolase [Paludibaculum fermentans]QOY88998.1 dienelactone hydrolase [Paludibaculum fermentans]